MTTEMDGDDWCSFCEDDEEERPLIEQVKVAGRLRRWVRDLERPQVERGKLCKVTHGRGNDLQCMGFNYEKAIHLYAEEALYLLERGKLVVRNISIEELYEIVDLDQYFVYAYFKQTSLIVFPVEDEESPDAVVLEAYAPSSKFSKRNPGQPIMYIMYGRSDEPFPSEHELLEVFAWAGRTPVKFALVSDECSVFAIDVGPRGLDHLEQPCEASTTVLKHLASSMDVGEKDI